MSDLGHAVDNLLRGAVDSHVHSYPDVIDRKVTDLTLVQQAKSAGTRRFGLEVSSWLYDGAGLAIAADLRRRFLGQSGVESTGRRLRLRLFRTVSGLGAAGYSATGRI